MKFLIIIVVCLVVANGQVPDSPQEMFSKALSECKDEVNATPGDVVQVLQLKDTATTEAKCLIACIAKRFHFMTATGEIDINAAKDTYKYVKSMGQDIYDKLTGVLDKCLGLAHVGDNECEVAYSFYTCGIDGAANANIPKFM